MSNTPIAYVVEDNPDLADIFMQALTAAGYQTSVIHDGDKALAQILASPPDLVVLDLHLPGIQGADILQQMRSYKATKDIRVFVASADARLAESLRGERTVILHKPIGFAQLHDLARRVIPTSATE